MSSGFQPVCLCEEVTDPGTHEFELIRDGEVISGFILHWRGCWYAYRNSCPHTRVGLNWLPNQFFDVGLEFIQCSLHGALFRPEDGYCIHGPCVGRSLDRLPITIRGMEVGFNPAELIRG